jgi:putative nucleotidyltransferase with HDIG domain
VSDYARFLAAFGHALATMSLYGEHHPARQRAIEGAYRWLRDLLDRDPHLQFSFLGSEILVGTEKLREVRSWEWGQRLADVGLQRIEVAGDVSFDDFDAFLAEAYDRVNGNGSSADARHTRPSSIRWGSAAILNVHAEEEVEERPREMRTLSLPIRLTEEAATVRWLHEEVSTAGRLPMLEVEAVVGSLAVGLASEGYALLPLLDLRDYDEYTTTHSLNVATLAIALAERLGFSGRDARQIGVAGLLHDLGKVRIPRDILVKPGRLTEPERLVMCSHPAEGARILLDQKRGLTLAAAVAYEHHIMIDGGGYPHPHFERGCHAASRLVHVCDVYDALRTHRPYRPAWENERTLSYIEERAGLEFDPDMVRVFAAMIRDVELRRMREDGTTAGS